eukprot:2660567-Alexandrium_andersonii.AAC.1
MSASLVGSEMCIRDSKAGKNRDRVHAPRPGPPARGEQGPSKGNGVQEILCLLYTSDAADDM